MKKDFDYTSRIKKINVIILAIIYVVSIVAIPMMNARYGGSDGQALVLGNASLSGILTAVQFIIAVAMTFLDYNSGGKLATWLLSISEVSSVIAVVFRHNYSAVPGVLYSLTGLVAVTLIKQGLSAQRRHSCFDNLTGISNRRHIISYIDYLIERKVPFYAIYLDLDHFKYINDTEGHERGDQVLKNVTSIWEKVDEKNAALGRLGGDEFIVVVPQSEVDDVFDYANKYLNAIREYLRPDSRTAMFLTCSAGTTSYPEDGKSSGDIVRKADMAMYNAKNSGRNMVCTYDASFEDKMLKDQYVEGRIRDALENGKFFMAYQPQFETGTHKLRGYESLIRMKTGSDIPLAPTEFIPIAEKSDLIIEIGEFVLKKAMSDFSEMLAVHPDKYLSVNISAKQLLSKDFVKTVMKIINETHFNPHNLEIEITEYCLLEYTEEAIEVINDLKDMGITLAMDDFGTGYSSLSYLTRLPIDYIKIDKSMIDTIGDGEIIGAIASMGHALGCKIIAEGVEYESQLEILKDKSVDYIQGFLWGRPMALQSALELLIPS